MGICNGMIQKESARADCRPRERKGMKGLNALLLYHKKKRLSTEIREGVSECIALLCITNEVAAVYGIGSVAMYDAAVPGWLPVSIGIGCVTVLGTLAHAAWVIMEHSGIIRRSRKCRRYGTIRPEEICRILNGGKS